MIARDPNAEHQGAEESGDEGIDVEALKESLAFVWRAPRRHRVLAFSVFLLVAGLGVTVAVTMPRMYNSTVKLLVQRDVVGPAITNPGLSIPHDSDKSTVAGTIMRRDNMIALVKESNLVERWHATRPAALRLKDTIFESLRGPTTAEEEIKVLAQTVEKRLQVSSDDNTVAISVDWQDPHMAYELATLVQKNFVGARYDADVTARQDTITVLEEHAKAAGEEVDAALAAYQATVDRLNGMVPGAAAGPAPVASGDTGARPQPTTYVRPAAPAAPDPDLVKALEEKRRQIRVFDEMHQRQIETLKQQLLQSQLTLTPQHPTVIALQQQVDTMSQPPRELAEMKNEERVLMAQIAPVSSAGGTVVTMGPQRSGFVSQDALLTAAVVRATKNELEDPGVAAARSRLAAVMDRYQGIMSRLDGARLELDMTRTAFRYRYSVITPAEVPRRPTKATAPLLGIASVLLAVFLAFLCSALADWQTGRIVETWQVRRYLKVDVLGEMDP